MKIKKYLLTALGGFLYTSGFPMFGTEFSVFFLPIIGVSFMLFSLDWSHPDWKKVIVNDIIIVLIFSLTYCLSGYYWIPYTLKEFGNIPFPINFLIGSSFSLIILPQYFFFILIKVLLKKTSELPTSKNLLIALTLTISEYYIPQQFPAHIGHPWLQLAPYLGLAPIFGVPIFSFFSFLAASALFYFFKSKKIDIFATSCFILFIVINIVLPIKIGNSTNSHFKVKAVQPNIRNDLKLSAENGKQLSLNEVFYFLKENSLKGETANLIIWPETAYPLLLSKKKLEKSELNIPITIREVINKSNTTLLFGGYDKAKENSGDYFETEYNSIFQINNDLSIGNVYHKIELIPFGESLPFGKWNIYFSKIIENISFFAKGKNYTTFEQKFENSKVFYTSAICYEILFSSFIRKYLNSVKKLPNFIVNVTNDSWYGNTSEPRQHLFLSHWRAIEFGLPIMRVTNTGITSLLLPDGSEGERINTDEQDSKNYKIPIHQRSITLFQKYGINLTIIFAIVLLLIATAIDMKSLRRLKSLPK